MRSILISEHCHAPCTTHLHADKAAGKLTDALLLACLWCKAEAIAVEVPEDQGQPIKCRSMSRLWSTAFLCLSHLHCLL